jgi:uncharacterized membrane protein
MIEYILKVAAVILWSSFKFVFGFITAILSGFNFAETLLFNVTGGMLGVIFYLYLWDFIVKLKRKIFPQKPIVGIKINSRRRLIVKFIKKYELVGIVILTPTILTVPIGTIIAATFEHNKWKIKRMMFFSFLGWNLVLYTFYTLFGHKLITMFNWIF